METGYYMYPAIYNDTVVFASDDDLWRVSASGGAAIRLTSTRLRPAHTAISPDGRTVAFTGMLEGIPEVYTVSVDGGPVTRRTYLGTMSTRVMGWTPCGKYILFATTAHEALRSHTVAYRISVDGGYPEKEAFGPAATISFSAANGAVLGRQGRDPCQWKRYRGGRIGEFWIDIAGTGEFQPFLEDLESNKTHPMWISDRIYFMGDHEGIGNLYSCTRDGKDMKRHTRHRDYYLRNPSTDGNRIVYHAGGDLFIYDTRSGDHSRINVTLPSDRKERNRRVVRAERHLEDYTLHPEAHSLAVETRGKAFYFAHWEGAPVQLGTPDGTVRYRMVRWLNDGKRLVMVSDEGGEEALEIYSSETNRRIRRLDGMDIGRGINMHVNPKADQVMITNHRQELIWVDLETDRMEVVDRSDWSRIRGVSWSPDGRWVAYGFRNTRKTMAIRIWDSREKTVHTVSRPVLEDTSPAFDPTGKYLYFLSARVFDPVRDDLSFDYNFPKGIQPMVVVLRAEDPSPFIPVPRAPAGGKKDEKDDGKQDIEVTIDFDGITNRIVAVPVPEGRYFIIAGGKNKIFMASEPVTGTLAAGWLSATPPTDRKLEVYDYDTQKLDLFVDGISDFELSADTETLAYRAGNRIRVIASQKKPEKSNDAGKPNRETGWIDLNRLTLKIYPHNEWLQMYREAWRLLRDQYYAADMAGVDWPAMYERYLHCVKRASCRSELSDIIWELGGELNTSHCYELGGDYPNRSVLPAGKLAVDFSFDADTGAYRIMRIVRGDSWDPDANSPFNQPGMNVSEGDLVSAVNGIPLSREFSPDEALLGMAGKEVVVTIGTGDDRRDVTVKTLRNDGVARLREWINTTTEYVHQRTGNRVGYIYMQDMGSTGYSQFHRAFLAEVQYEALIVDVRNNAGGHVSQLLLEKLARPRLGYDIHRHSKPHPIPTDSAMGPIVALCDEYSGSDGDIFSHTFKQRKLGTLIGKRTWGGVVGLHPTHPLVDGSVTTQPEFYNYFLDVGWHLENRGAEPDISVDIPPQAFVNGHDPQMERALEVIMEQLKSAPPAIPEFPPPPVRNAPDLPE